MRDSHVAAGSRRLMLLSIAAMTVLHGSVAAQLSDSGSAVGFQDSAQVWAPFFEQYDDCTGQGSASQQFPDFGDSVLQAADDFIVSRTTDVGQIVALGSFSLDGPMGPVTVEIYAGNGPGGLPGRLICSETGLPSSGPDGTIDVWMDGSCWLRGGIHWLSVYPVMSFEDFGQWFWNSNGSGYGPSEFAFRDPDGLVETPCTTWGLGRTDCGIGATFPDLCFGVGEYSVGDGGVPDVPAVGAAGTIVLLLVLLAVATYVLRRRRTA